MEFVFFCTRIQRSAAIGKQIKTHSANKSPMNIRQTSPADQNAILAVEAAAFSRQDEANLTRTLLRDPSAQPSLSLLAYINDEPVGHILFTKATLSSHTKIPASILAPLAVIPRFQKQGIGGALIKVGLQLQAEAGVELVFVLGHPTYYPRFGFQPAFPLGFEATYPIPEKDKAAWMVQELKPGVIGSVSGRIICCDAMNKPEYWRE